MRDTRYPTLPDTKRPDLTDRPTAVIHETDLTERL